MDVNKVSDPLGNIFIYLSVAEITVDTTECGVHLYRQF